MKPLLSSPLAAQIARFVVVGVINTAVDLCVLNSLMFFFGTGPEGGLYAVWKGCSFAVAVINSYLLNRFWVFASAQSTLGTRFAQFIAVSIVGFWLNVLVASLVFHTLAGIYTVHVQLLGSVAAIAGTCVVLVWNFVGYKFFVFAS